MTNNECFPGFELGIPPGITHGRCVRDGYNRGWGLQWGGLAEKISADPLYIEALRLAEGRSILSPLSRMNLFLILKFYAAAIPPGDIIEFGAYKGGNAIFMAKVCAELGLSSTVWALDTFAGMPETDKTVDSHSAEDFNDADLVELTQYIETCGLKNIHLVKGMFEETVPLLLTRAAPFILAYIDCDIRSAVRYSYNTVKHHMVNGGYIAFDDAHTSTCLGATEVVEADVIRRDGLHCEQIYPHFVFRIFKTAAQVGAAGAAESRWARIRSFALLRKSSGGAFRVLARQRQLASGPVCVPAAYCGKSAD
jgi:Macrocin-O-methyltransferase (TylF)